MGKINIAIIGVGNRASSPVQGVRYYKKAKGDDLIAGPDEPEGDECPIPKK